MSNETFQIIVSAAVGLAILSLIVQSLAVLACYRSVRDTVTRLSPFLLRTKAILAAEKDSIRRIEIVIDKTQLSVDILERVGPRISTLAGRLETVAAHAMRLGPPLAELEQSAERTVAATHLTLRELSPGLRLVVAETSALAGSADDQFRRVIRVFRDAFTHFLHLRQFVASK
jgi:ABC-type transporter Mla subunit MlaD